VEDAADELDELLGDSVTLRMHADVPVGGLLSGGIDSSLVTALMRARHNAAVRTFTIAFDDEAYDEAVHARKLADHLGTEHTELTVRAEDALDVVPQLPALYDEPFADSSQVPTAVLARLTRRHVTVALAGDGGDELFGGYNRYAWAEHFWRRLSVVPRPLRRIAAGAMRSVPPTRWDAFFGAARPILPRRLDVRNPGTKIHKAAAVLPAADLDETYRLLASHFPDPSALVLGAREHQTHLTDGAADPTGGDPVERMMYLDALTYLPDDILTKVDRAAMASSLETRLPFLDHRIAALAWSLPLDMKVRAGQGKWILRHLLHRYVPPELVDRPKAGFGIPLADWLRKPLRPWAEDLLDAGRLRNEGYLDAVVVRRLWDDHLGGGVDRAYELWDVLMFEAWLQAR
jgi:asparagine synthase (glutamine-hydrolysing)